MAPRAFRRRRVLAAWVIVGLGAAAGWATPPKPPWRMLEERAAAEGVGAVRARYRSHVDRLVASVPAAAPASVDELGRRELAVAWLLDFVRSWAEVEARAIRLTSHVAPEVLGQVGESILAAARVAVVEVATLRSAALTLRRAAPADGSTRAARTLDAADGLARNQDAMAERVAVLGLLSEDRALLARTFRVLGGRAGAFRSADDLHQSPPDVDAILGIDRAAMPAAAMGPGLPPVTPDEAQAVRDLIQQLDDAILARRRAQVAKLFARRPTARAFLSRLAASRVVAFDLGRATFRVERVDMSTVDVQVEGIATTRVVAGQQTHGVGRKRYRVVWRDGRALLERVGAG